MLEDHWDGISSKRGDRDDDKVREKHVHALHCQGRQRPAFRAFPTRTWAHLN
jgi:hypothetical protein